MTATNEQYCDEIYNGSGVLVSKEFRINGNLHSIGGRPSLIRYYSDGSIFQEAWHTGDKLNRYREPASIQYDFHGDRIKQWWYREGIWHNDIGPGYVTKLRDGDWHEWRWRGEEYNYEEWVKLAKPSDAVLVELKLRYGLDAKHQNYKR